jgi:outer membrane scaffolding protein for murein synthesis (MipA/OmpV family)
MKKPVISLATLMLFAGIAQANPADTSYLVGGGFSYLPRYAGSKDYRVAPQLVASAHFSNGFFADLAQGVGYEITLGQHWVFTGSAGFDPGRKDQNDAIRPGSDFLKGMGDIRQSAVGNVGATYRFSEIADVSVVASKALGHSYGATLHLQGRLAVWQADHDSIELTGSVDIANRDYTQTYFGVTQEQSRASRFAPFVGRGGIYAEQAGVSWTHALGTHWSSRLTLGGTHYAKAVSDSPVVQKANAVGGAYALVYQF